MKKYIYILCALLTGAFASCSQNEPGDETPQTTHRVTLQVTASDGLQTRANATGVNRFAIEVYTDAAYTTATNVFADETTNKAISTTGEFAMVLDRTQAYYCLLWADKDGADVYTITDLKAVTLSGKAAEAWQGTKSIAAGETTLTAHLNRAVSKITLLETGKLPANSTLKLNFSQPTAFNVATGASSGTSARPEETITIAADVDGTTTPATLATDIFVLSSVATADLTDLTFQFGSEAVFTVPQAPLKANFNTNIKGHYTTASTTTFTATCDDSWGTTDNEVGGTYAIGDLYPNATNPVGMVFWINPQKGASPKGMIVSLDKGTEKNWADAQAWTSSKSLPSGMTWQIPDIDILKALYAGTSGLNLVSSGAGAGEINIWDNGNKMSDYANYADARAAFDATLTSAGGASIDAVSYWSSSTKDTSSAWLIYMGDFGGYVSDMSKNAARTVRAIAQF